MKVTIPSKQGKMNGPQSPIWASKCGVPCGTANLLKPKLQALWPALRHQWKCSLLRTILGEFYRFPRRIAAIRRASTIRFGPAIPLGCEGHTLETWDLRHTFVRACSEDIQRLWLEHPWAGALEVQMAAVAYQRGATWGSRNSYNKDSNEAA